jgi:hypothetical protein
LKEGKAEPFSVPNIPPVFSGKAPPLGVGREAPCPTEGPAPAPGFREQRVRAQARYRGFSPVRSWGRKGLNPLTRKISSGY